MYIYMYICIHVYTYEYIRTYIYIYINTYAHTHMYVGGLGWVTSCVSVINQTLSWDFR